MTTSNQLLIPLLDNPWIWITISYLLGALPFAVWVGRKAGRDPRASGSKNPGASNVARTAGMRWGLITLILDACKGSLIPALILGGYLISDPQQVPQEVTAELFSRITWYSGLEEWAAFTGVSAVLGHITSPFLNFRGGRGVATAIGVMFALHFGLASLSVFVWLTVLMLSRTPAWSSLALSACFIIFSQASNVDDSVRIFSVCAATLIVIRHWTHLKKLYTILSPKN